MQRHAAGRAGRVDDEAAEGRAERGGETPNAGEDPESGGEQLQSQQLHLAHNKVGMMDSTNKCLRATSMEDVTAGQAERERPNKMQITVKEVKS